MKKMLAALALALVVVAGCIQPENPFFAPGDEGIEGSELILTTRLENPDGTLTGIEEISKNRFKVNVSESEQQHLIVLIGNRLDRAIDIEDGESSFLCRGINQAGGTTELGVTPIDTYYECLNCESKQSCRLIDAVPGEQNVEGCVLEKGKTLARIEKEAGLNFVTIVMPEEGLNAEMVCDYSLTAEGTAHEISFNVEYHSG